MALSLAQEKIYDSSIVQSALKGVQWPIIHTLLGSHVILTNALEAALILNCKLH